MKQESRLLRDPWGSVLSRGRAVALGVGIGVLFGALVATSSIASAAAKATSPISDTSVVLSSRGDTGIMAASTQNSVATQAAPQCPAGQIPILRNTSQPTGRSGPPTPEAALRLAHPSVGAFTAYPWFERASSAGPVWLVAGGETFLALRLPDGGWFVTRSTFVGCRVPFSR
jgi:hypothetical protein